MVPLTIYILERKEDEDRLKEFQETKERSKGEGGHHICLHPNNFEL